MGIPMNDSPQSSANQSLAAIYAALAGGVFIYAAIVLFVLDPADSSIDSNVLRLAWFGLAAAAMMGAGVIRGRASASRNDPGRMRAYAIIVWALAEGQALLGITATLLTGDRILAYGSLAIFVWIWLRYPPRSFLSG